MEMIFEATMVAALCIGVGILLYRFAAGKSVHLRQDRFTVITMGIGFLFGGASKAIITPVPWTVLVYIAGVCLCCCATAFSFLSRKGTAYE